MTEHSDVYHVPKKPDFFVTTNGVTAGSGTNYIHTGSNPLKWAIENCSGKVVVGPGRYDIGKIDEAPGGRFVAVTKHGVVIDGYKEGDTMSMMNGAKIEPLVFCGFLFECRSRSAWITEASNPPYRVSFEDCIIDGGYDWSTDTGFKAKWGLMPHRWAGYALRCEFRNIYREHGIYCHTPESDILIQECSFKHCGRTGMQFVGRSTEDGYSNHTLRVNDCVFEDCGLKDGGSHLTAQGISEVHIRRLKSYIGRDIVFAQKYMENHPEKNVFGTGHIVNWTEQGRNMPTKFIGMDDTEVWSRPGELYDMKNQRHFECGHAAAIQIKNSERLSLMGEIKAEAGYNPHEWEVKAGTVVDFYPTIWDGGKVVVS